MLLEALILSAMNAICGVGRTVENEKSKRDTAKLTPEGNVMSIGRTGQIYYNGEQTYEWTEYDKYGQEHKLTIGMKSGKVYRDSYDRWKKESDMRAEERRQYAIKHDCPTYLKYVPQVQAEIEVEVKTGKPITKFGRFHNKKTGEVTYRKWYLQPCQKTRFDYNRTTKGDKGVEITKEEYEKLYNRVHYLDGLPNDPALLNELLGVDCF